VLVANWIGAGEVASHKLSQKCFSNIFLAVADGLGGHSAGEIASRLVLDRLSSKSAKLKVSDVDGLTSTILDIHEEVLSKSLATPSLQGMGSTLAAAIVSPSEMTLLNVGDSRIYLSVNGGELCQVSTDDRLSPQEASLRHANVITQAIGGSSRRRRLEPHILSLKAHAPWTLLICSDGLTDYVDDREFVRAAIDEQYVADDFVKKALDAGGVDNVSVIVARGLHVTA
jgi:protein phosphatase